MPSTLTITAKLIILGVILAGIGAGTYKIYQHGKSAGYDEGQRMQGDLDAKSVKSEVAELKTQLTDATQKQQQSELREKVADARAQRAQAATEALAKQKQQTNAQIDGLADKELFHDITHRLGRVTGPDDSAFLPGELRAIDKALANQDNVNATLIQMNERLNAVQAGLDEVRGQLTAEKGKSVILVSKYNDLLGHYERIYDGAQPRVPLLVKIFTLGIKKPKKFNAPAPVSLTLPSTPEKTQ